MAQTNLVEQSPQNLQAKNWQAIVSHLQLQLKQEGITVKVARKNNNLYIILEFLGEKPPQQQQVKEILQKALDPLHQSGIATVKVGAQKKGASTPVWVEKVELNNLILARDLVQWSQGDSKINPATWGYAPRVAFSEGKKYLRFILGDRLITLLPLDNIREVVKISPQKVLAVPHSPDWLLGIYDWRGELIWLADLNRLLGFSRADLPSGGMMISLQIQQKTLGFFIPQVEEIEQHATDKLQEPVPGLVPSHLLPYVRGYINSTNSIILAPDRLMERIQQFTS